MTSNNRGDKRGTKTTPPREDTPAGARSFDNKEPPPNVRNATQQQNAERTTPRSKR